MAYYNAGKFKLNEPMTVGMHFELKQLKPLSKEWLIIGYHQIISLLLANSREGWCWEMVTQNVWYVSYDENLQSPCSGDTREIENHIYGKNQISICTTKPTLFFSSPVICLCLQKNFHFIFYIEKLST